VSDPITDTQLRSIHQYYDDLSVQFQAAGLDMRKILKPTVEIPATPHLIKELMAKPIMQAMFDKDSTLDLSTTEVGELYQVMSRHIAQRFGISVPFPNRFNHE